MYKELHKEKMVGKRGIYFGLVFLAVILVSSIVFGQEEPELGPFNTTVSVTNEVPSIVFVSNPGTVLPLEGTIRSVGVSFIAEDPNGGQDLSASGGLTFDGFALPQTLILYNITCPQDVTCAGCTSNQRNYSCFIDMQYYYDPGTWNIVANITDSVNNFAENATQSFVYGTLEAVQHEIGIIWTNIGLGVGDIDQTSDGDPPIILLNRGNVALLVNITGHNLTGQSLPIQRILSERFTVSPNNSSQPNPLQCNAPLSATRLNVDDGSVPPEGIPITGALVPYGAPGVGLDEEELYYCIPETLNDLGLSDPLGYRTEILDQWEIHV